jgi:predicted nuclease of predicted toxin-antitoxin system
MRILLDENFPADLAALLVGHDASNVHTHGWAGIKNGELLRRAHGVCDVFVTLDRNLEFQQNIDVPPLLSSVWVQSLPLLSPGNLQ